ncbi:activator 1 subunit 3 [Usnea florida]
MSDYEDDMDVDDAPTKESVMFSSDNTNVKGKRSAANLPVEAEDSLPWVEKYRPDTLDDVSGHQDILATINKFVDTNRLPHLLLYGPPGTGKTSTILALARRIYGNRNMRQMVLELNASDDRGIDVVREQIRTFASTKQIFSAAPKAGDTPSLGAYKLIVLDEADAMTSVAQMALRRIMEKYTANTRFCIIANYTHKLSPALLSRCTRFRFSPLKEADIRHLVDIVVEKEDVKIQLEAVDSLVRLSKGDMRRALNVLQACHASNSSMRIQAAHVDPGTPLHIKGQPPPKNAKRETITNTTIYDCIAAPHPSDIQLIRDTLMETADVTSCLNTVNMLKANKGLALADILTALGDELAKLEVPPQTRVAWLSGLAEVEYRLSGGGSEVMQTGGLVGVVRGGVDLMEHGGTI